MSLTKQVKRARKDELSGVELDALQAARDTDDGDLGFCVNAKRLVQMGYHVEVARGAFRALAARGFVEYQRGLFGDDGSVAGSGYGITPAGRTALAEIESRRPHAPLAVAKLAP